jgi:hypothetical protein
MQWCLKSIGCLVWMGIISMNSDQYDTLHNRRLNEMLYLICIFVLNSALGQPSIARPYESIAGR